MSVRIGPSILAADFGRLADEVARVEAAGADMLHIDIMDGHFVPTISFGPLVTAAVRRATRLPLDVHLMVQDPDHFLDVFAEAGAAMVSVHVEAAPHLHRTVARIHQLGMKAGAAINPATPVDALSDVLPDLDHVLVMSVDPGYSGQAFIPHSLEKLALVRDRLKAIGKAADIEIDGGVTAANAEAVVRAGATILVAGAAVFSNPDPGAALRALRTAAAKAR
jgi:ribulose-phosphate 3-epimerase